MASLQTPWLTSFNTISATKSTIFSSTNLCTTSPFKPIKVFCSLNPENAESFAPTSPNSPETTTEAQPGPTDPVKIAFAKAKEYKKSALSNSNSKIEQSPVENRVSTANGNGGSDSNIAQNDAGDGTKEVPLSLKIAMEKAKKYKKNKGILGDGSKDSLENGTIQGLEGGNEGSLRNSSVDKMGKKEQLSVSSIDFVGLGFADKKEGRALPAGLVPVVDPFSVGDLPEVEIIVGDTSMFEAETTPKPEQKQNIDSDLYKPKVSSWGVFPRPGNISKEYGGGRVIRPGEVLETAEEKAAKEARTRQLLAAYKKKFGLSIDAKLKSECEEALKDGDSLMNLGRLKEALPYYEKVMEKLTFQSELHGLAALQWSICQDSLRRSNEARIMYEKLQSHPKAQVSKKARQFMFSFQAMEMMKVTAGSPFSVKNAGYQDYFEAFVEKKSNYALNEDEVQETALDQVLPYIIFLVSPILVVLLIAVQKVNIN